LNGKRIQKLHDEAYADVVLMQTVVDFVERVANFRSTRQVKYELYKMCKHALNNASVRVTKLTDQINDPT